jgi:N-acetyl-anhydromuramyl-L-alanine amidase AmpD|tara:strand:+ start:173 stop:757 length:585 start_codon:yes stop_codon:yes gene_type:complete
MRGATRRLAWNSVYRKANIIYRNNYNAIFKKQNIKSTTRKNTKKTMIKRELTDTIVIHCSATPPTMDIGSEKIREWHVKENGWYDIGYHYIITRDGVIESARSEELQGSHALKVNFRSIGICMIGGYNYKNEWDNNFTHEQWVALKALLLNLIKKYDIIKIIGHYQVDNKKKCPSFKVPEYLKENDLQDYINIG